MKMISTKAVQPVTPPDSTYRQGFTLAEVLITLGIIGIVAALTIPTLIQSYKEKYYITHLKKSYSVLQNAFQMAIAEHGPINQWGLTLTNTDWDEEDNAIIDNTSANLIFSYIKPYLKIASNNIETEQDIYEYLSLDGQKRELVPTVSTNEQNYSATLVDGTYFSIGWITSPKCTNHDEICGDFWIYLPDKKKQLGVTQFHFIITKNGLKPNGMKEKYMHSFENYCDIKNKNGGSSDQQGRGCTAWAIYEGNMNYLHCDNLSWDGNKKCK